ncbi:GTP-binding protein [Alcanivorax sp. 1008]|nr:GTP-binding protein [Alcanivorax sp. 1008]
MPVFVLTGFLGSGKTTLLNALLPHYPDSALVINELGDVGIDDQLIEDRSVPVTLLAGGCVCCTVRGTLNSTLRNLWMARRSASIPRFNRLIIETTGAADPWGLIETLMRDRFLERHYRLASVITTVDMRRGVEGLKAFPEVIEQVLVADVLLMTHADQASAAQQLEMCAGLAGLNSAARIESMQPGELPDLSLDDAAETRCRFTGLTDATSFRPAAAGAGMALPAGALQSLRHADSTIHAASMRIDEPLERWSLMRALEQVLGENARRLLRFKGLFKVAGDAGPLLVQAVAQGMDEPRSLPAWPGPDHDSRMVLIVDTTDNSLPDRLLARIKMLALSNEAAG